MGCIESSDTIGPPGILHVKKVEDALALFKDRSYLNEGLTSKVYSAVLHHNMELKCVVKVISKTEMGAEKARDSFKTEVQVLSRLNHKNIVKFIGAFEDDKQYIIQQEFLMGGELFDYILDHYDENDEMSFPEQKASRIIKQILSCLAYLKKNNIAHQDIKAENNILRKESNGDEDVEICIIDFGFAQEVVLDRKYDTIAGTMVYLAPEAIRLAASGRTGAQLLAADMWSLGVIVYMMYTGVYPVDCPELEGTNEYQEALMEKLGSIEEIDFSDIDASDDALDFLKQILQIDTSKRLTPEKALAHPWITKAETNTNEIGSKSLNVLKETYREAQISRALRTIYKLLADAQPKIQNIFNSIDKDHDGNITKEELYEFFQKECVQEDLINEKVHSFFKAHDADRNGFIDLKELEDACCDMVISSNEAIVASMFKTLDADHSGRIDLDEMKTVFGEVDAEKMLHL